MKKSKLTAREYFVPFALITSLFFFWGIAHGMLDMLKKYFQEILHLMKSQSGLIQFSVYMASFGMALSAGYYMSRFEYKKGITLGLSLFASGALFSPAMGRIADVYGMSVEFFTPVSFFIFILYFAVSGHKIAILFNTKV